MLWKIRSLSKCTEICIIMAAYFTLKPDAENMFYAFIISQMLFLGFLKKHVSGTCLCRSHCGWLPVDWGALSAF